MLPERWQDVERLYFSALECNPAIRARFLAEATDGDRDLLEEVQSLLDQPGSDSRLDRPVWGRGGEVRPTHLIVGTRLGSYEIEAFLGAGGMGKVFRARDTRLNRTVAIKFSKLHFTEAFRREARAAAALNHPNVVQIYELGSADGDEFIVMEFIPGRSLAELIREKRLSLEEALACSHQIVSALAAAHAAGIVHGDIKPGNIIVNDETGVVKILDFGLAMLEHRSLSDGGTPSIHEGMADPALGTPSYMSPEQAEGRPVDVRSDVFSTGVVLYELFTGVRAFPGDSTYGILSRVIHESPAEHLESHHEVPLAIRKVISRCLEKDPGQRYSSGGELANALIKCSRPAQLVALTPRVIALIVLVLIAAIGTAAWLHNQNQHARWTRDEALPKIQALTQQGDYLSAFTLTRTALRYAPDDPQLKQHWLNVSQALNMTTVPPGAKVSIRPFGDANMAWQSIGKTPLEGVRVPLANVRIRIAKEGMEPLEFGTTTFFLQDQKIALYRTGTIPAGMVAVPQQAPPAGPVKIMPLPDYFLDKFEVTNSQFQQFVSAGGYRRRDYWRYPFFRDGHEISWHQALAGFRDRTGHEGPALWELGAFPKGQADYPVAGVNWFEAAAYCQSVGKSLPTMYHWQKAAGFGLFSDILLLSNFTHNGPMRVGANPGITPFGAYDMAGNVKEWVQNEAGGRRVILGGSFDDSMHAFHNLDAQDPFSRLPTFGIRCASFPTPVPAAALLPPAPPERDYATEKPVKNAFFEFIRRMYTYEKTPLLAKTESVDDSNEIWRKETVSYAAAYGGERIPAYLFLPKNVDPPYQTVLWVPGGYAQFLRSSVTGAGSNEFDFLIRSGRAVLYPIYKGTFERHVGNLERPDVYRECMIQFAKDASRSVDYLETRSDIQIARLGYYGFSWGGTMGPVLLALDPRLKAGVLVGGGLYQQRVAPEIDILNFAPHVRIPVLMFGGRYDFVKPPATAQRPMFQLLGSGDSNKRYVQFESGHVPPVGFWMNETLNWLDRYLGPVKTKAIANP